ncbi:MAG: hypothetical protein IJ465_01985, partial [Clostridia bacterium]|nr:hypothetical protein [Clostridia bacterium]
MSLVTEHKDLFRGVEAHTEAERRIENDLAVVTLAPIKGRGNAQIEVEQLGGGSRREHDLISRIALVIKRIVQKLIHRVACAVFRITAQIAVIILDFDDEAVILHLIVSRTHTGRHRGFGSTYVEVLTGRQVGRLCHDGELCTGSSPTVSDWYQQWRRLYKEPADLTAKSLSAYDEKFRNYIRPAIGHMKLRDVREQHLQQILHAQSGMSHSHLVKLRSLMQQLFRRARKSRLIVFDPSEDLSLPAYRRGTRRSLTDAERRAFLAAEPQ